MSNTHHDTATRIARIVFRICGSLMALATFGSLAMLVFAVRAGDVVHAAMAALLIIFFGWLSAYCWSPRRTADDLGNDW